MGNFCTKPVILLLFGFFTATVVSAQPFNDPCFTSPTISTSFAGTANVSNNNADCMSWNGSGWTGSWPGANLTLAPPGGVVGTRAIWSGDGTVWTTGGEGFGLRLMSSIVTGTTYSFTYRRVSHGTGQNGNFVPSLYTNTTGTFGYLVGPIPGVGTSWTATAISFTAVAAQNGHTWVYFHNSSGSGMFLACTVVVLPMEFFAFEGWTSMEDVVLNWKTKNEGDFVKHEVQLSLDGSEFVTVDDVPAVHSGEEAHTYDWKHSGAALGISREAWFRIRSLDIEGIETFSPVITVAFSPGQSIHATLMPNPVSNGASATLSVHAAAAGEYNVEVIDYSGRKVMALPKSMNAGMNELAMSTAGLKPGIYWVRIEGMGSSETLKWMVE